MAIELLPNSGNFLSVNKRGQLKVSLKFRTALDKNINVIVYCQYQSVLEIDADKRVILDH